jgi:hypothetical protein
MCRLPWNLGASTSWNPMGLSKPVMELIFLLPNFFKFQQLWFDLQTFRIQISFCKLDIRSLSVFSPLIVCILYQKCVINKTSDIRRNKSNVGQTPLLNKQKKEWLKDCETNSLWGFRGATCTQMIRCPSAISNFILMTVILAVSSSLEPVRQLASERWGALYCDNNRSQ